MERKIVRWGLLSTARINERLISPIRGNERSQLLAVASRRLDRAQEYADHWEIPHAHGSYEQLLTDPDIDVVYLSLPNGLHTEWTVKCADAGKHILCEKPLALTIEAVDRIEQAAQRNGVIVQEAAMMRFHPQIDYVRQLVADEVIGPIRLFRGIFSCVLNNEQDVRMDPNQGGGSLWDLGSYCVRFVRSILQEEPEKVLASQVSSDRGVDLSLAGEMKFPAGAHGQFFSSLEAFGHVEADLLGSKGRIRLSSPWVNQLDRDAHVHLIRHDGSPPKGDWDDGMLNQTVETKTFPNINAYEDEVRSMVASVLDEAPPVIPLSDSRQNTAVMLALLESAASGRAIQV